MKIIIKDKKNEYDIEIKSDEITVEELKNEIQKKLDVDINTIKLLYNSKILSNENKLNFYEIKDCSTLILLLNKNDNKMKQDNNAGPLPSKDKNIEQLSFKIETLVSMGYSKEKAQAALYQTEGDINKAINILLEEKDTNNTNNINNNNINNNNINNNNINNNNFLSNIKNKIQDLKPTKKETSLPKELKKYAIFMKILTLDDPNQMNIILQNIKEKSPALLERIKDNEEEFVKYLSLPITNEDIEIYKKNFKYDRELFKGDKEENKLGKVEINLNKKESTDINKLKELGYKIPDIIEAYLLKNKNYKETENYLKSNKKV